MILVDDRKGSAHLAPILNRLGAASGVQRLTFGDAAFTGHGPHGPVSVGVEVKKIDDLIASMISRRLTTRQLPGMRSCYDEVIIAVVGQTAADETGGIMEWRWGKWWRIPTSLSWEQLEGMKMSLRYGYHTTLVEFPDDRHLAQWLVVAADWWGRPWADHKSHLPTHTIFDEGQEDGERPQPFEPTNPYLVANVIPGLGMSLGKKVAGEFRTVKDMAAAPMSRWAEIDGIGKKKAAEAYLFFNERKRRMR